ncbi:hypothetical protein PMI11_00001, partial [Rhizobium sp. CF142]
MGIVWAARFSERAANPIEWRL